MFEELGRGFEGEVGLRESERTCRLCGNLHELCFVYRFVCLLGKSVPV